MFNKLPPHNKLSIPSLVFLAIDIFSACGGNKLSVTDCNDKPQLIEKFEPEYPRMVTQAGIEGYVILSFTVDTIGNVTNIEIVTSGIAVLDEAAKNAVSQYKYTPACSMGHPVESRVTTVIEFRLD